MSQTIQTKISDVNRLELNIRDLVVKYHSVVGAIEENIIEPETKTAWLVSDLSTMEIWFRR